MASNCLSYLHQIVYLLYQKVFKLSCGWNIAQSTLAVVWNDVWLIDCFEKNVLGILYLILNL